MRRAFTLPPPRYCGLCLSLHCRRRLATRRCCLSRVLLGVLALFRRRRRRGWLKRVFYRLRSDPLCNSLLPRRDDINININTVVTLTSILMMIISTGFDTEAMREPPAAAAAGAALHLLVKYAPLLLLLLLRPVLASCDAQRKLPLRLDPRTNRWA